MQNWKIVDIIGNFILSIFCLWGKCLVKVDEFTFNWLKFWNINVPELLNLLYLYEMSYSLQ